MPGQEDDFGDHGAGKQAAELKTQHRNDRQHRVGKTVTASPRLRSALQRAVRRKEVRTRSRADCCASCDVVIAAIDRPRVIAGGTRLPDSRLPLTGVNRDRRKTTVPAGPSQKLGNRHPDQRERLRQAVWPAPRWRAAMMPSGIAISSTSTIPPPPVAGVAGSRCLIRSVTGCSRTSESPRSPCARST